ncbi:MAG: carbohydrate-binding domain-containing protein [Faecousia sp.]
MKKQLSLLLAAACLVSLLAGCGQKPLSTAAETADATTAAQTPNGADGDAATVTDGAAAASDSELFTKRDCDSSYDESTAILIELSGSTAAASDDSVNISGSVITLTEDGTYILTGTLDDGTILVDMDDSAKPQLVLNGADIHSQTSAALYIRSADKVFVTLAGGTENTLSNGGSFAQTDDNNVDGAVFSKEDLTFNGSGSLCVTSPAGHGIVCKDDLVFTGGTYDITAACHGLDVNDSVRIAAAALTVNAGKDGVHCENEDDTISGFVYLSGCTMDVEAQGDGISAGAYFQMEDGAVTLLCGGGSANGTKASSDAYGGFMGRPGFMPQQEDTQSDSVSMKGVKTAGALLFDGGSLCVDAADDALHAAETITVSGGTLELATGDDGLHADDTLTVTGGTIHISQSYEGLEAQHVLVQGGSIDVTASDDGLNASGGMDSSGMTGGRDGRFGGGGAMASSDGSIEITGGTVTVAASGDGLDANGSINITGGDIRVANPTAADTSVLDADTDAMISGGTFLGIGSTTMMAQSFSTSSSQGVIACTTGSQTAGAEITVTDSAGNSVLTFTADYDFVLVILSTPDIVKGETYTLTVGEISGSVEAS